MFKKIKSISLTAILFCFFCFSNVGLSYGKEVDSFQQIMNYLFIGNALDDGKVDNLYYAKIFDREKCIAGWEDSAGGFLKIYWNNIDIDSIKSQDKFADGVWMKYILFSGHPVVAEVELKNFFVIMGLAAKGVATGKYSFISIPLGQPETRDDERMAKAIQLLYSKHCTGLKTKMAF